MGQKRLKTKNIGTPKNNLRGYGGIIMPNTKNPGKRFEQDFYNSIDRGRCFIHRLKDTAQSYNNSGGTKFTWNNPCDFFLL